MPVQTRSVAKKLASEPNRGNPLTAQGTIVEVEVSATGEGTHTRWRRPADPEAQQPSEGPKMHPSPRKTVQRYITPAMNHPPLPPTPPTPRPQRNPSYIYRQPGSRSPPTEVTLDFARAKGTAKGKDLTAQFLEQFHRGKITPPVSRSGGQDSPSPLGPPFIERPHTPANTVLTEASWGNSFTESETVIVWAPDDEARSNVRARARGLGPEGTILVDEATGEPLISGLRKGC